MAKPSIVLTQSVLGFLQWQEFSFQPYATESPTGWTSSPLPAGVTLDGVTGEVSGAAEKPGVYLFSLTATNGDGDSAPVVFCMGIEASVQDPTANVIDLTVDLGTREVTAYLSVAEALFVGKYGDDLIFRVQFARSGVPVTITMTTLKLVMKELEPEGIIAESTTFSDLGGGRHLVYLPLTGSALQGALSNYEDDKATTFPAICEFEWTAPNALGVGPDPARGSSRSFRGDVVRDLAPQ